MQNLPLVGNTVLGQSTKTEIMSVNGINRYIFAKSDKKSAHHVKGMVTESFEIK